jgi:hypothetical protein
MVEDGVIAHVLLYFQNIFDLFEVVGDFRRHLVEMLLRVEQQILCEFVSFANLFDVPRELSNELFDFLCLSVLMGSFRAVGRRTAEEFLTTLTIL